MTEQWRAVAGFEAYEVSDLGRVRSNLPWNGTLGRILKPNVLRKGYLSVRLYKDGKGNDRLTSQTR